MGKNRTRDLVIFILLLIITIVGEIYTVFLFRASFYSGNEVSLTYSEESLFDYKVWLQENDFYEEEYLGEDYNVIADAIDEIEIDFDYNLNFSDYVQGSSYYTINSRIVAYQKGDLSEKKIWDYNKLIRDRAITIYDVDTLKINNANNFRIDYQEYRELMNDYKNNYGVSLVGDLIIEIDIKSNLSYSKFTNNIDLDNRRMFLTIPLTDSVVSISKDNIDMSSQTLIEKGETKINYLKLSLSLIAFVLGFSLCVFLGLTLAKLVGYDSKYDRELKRILRTYGSIIVNVKQFKFDNNEKIIYVDSISELLDAQQELRKPILFYNVKFNKKASFALRYDNDVLVYNMNSSLYNNEKK